MRITGFSPEVQQKLGWYVYRLLDENKQTFYVGKGRGNRVFAHARAAADVELNVGEDRGSLKLDTIRRMIEKGHDVTHVIHRHGIANSEIAYIVESALIEAYAGLSNLVRGHGTSDYGCRTAEELQIYYAAEEFEVREPLILIYIGLADAQNRDPYDAVRYAWRMSKSKAEQFKLVLAYSHAGIVKGAFRPGSWQAATVQNFPGLEADMVGRIGFEGRRAEPEVWDYYVGKKGPPKKRGSQSPFLYLYPRPQPLAPVADGDRSNRFSWGPGDLVRIKT